MNLEKRTGRVNKTEPKILQTDDDGSYFANMESFLQYLTPKRLELLNIVKLCGPVTVEVLAQALKRTRESVYADVLVLGRDRLVGKIKGGALLVGWDEIAITVTQSRYMRDIGNKKVIDMPTKYLCLAARRLPWLIINIKLKCIKAGKRSFKCVLEVRKKTS